MQPADSPRPSLDDPESTGTPAPAACACCGAPRTGPYCAACGQRAYDAPLTLRALARRAVMPAFDLDRGLLHTFVELFRRPGRVGDDYVRGRTVPYTNPLKYFVLVVALVQVVAFASGTAASVAAALAARAGVGSPGELVTLMDRFFVLYAAPAVPLFAAIQWLLFRGSGRSYAESLVFALWVAAQELLLVLPFVALPRLQTETGLAYGVLPLVTLYYLWAAPGFFRLPLWQSLLRALLVVVVSVATLPVTILFVLGVVVGMLL